MGYACHRGRHHRRGCRAHGSSLGIKTLLVDANDFVFGTSSRLSKLIQGGFRYLYNLQFQVTIDFGIVIDTLECTVNWEQLPEVHKQVRAVVKKRPKTICMTHISHAYPQGANLYFIFIIRYENLNNYLNLQYNILEAICQSRAAMSHHHGIGKQTAPWLKEQIGSQCMDIIRTLKKLFDPNNIINPGGTLGLDMNKEQKPKHWGYISKA